MTITDNTLTAAESAFVEQVTATAERAFRVLRETGTISASGTVQVNERLPGLDGAPDKLVGLLFPNAWKRQTRVTPNVFGFDGTSFLGDPRAGGGARRFAAIFEQHPDVTTVVHVHTPYLGAFAQAHRTFPIRYVAAQRHTIVTELPVYIDRRQAEVDFILEQLGRDPDIPAIVEANGGATVWGRNGLQATAEFIQLLEEGAQFQTLAEALGGSQEYGPGVLAQQWTMTGLLDAARDKGLLPKTDLTTRN
jgi:L-ribulose-5-phosphate 4-epimerase